MYISEVPLWDNKSLEREKRENTIKNEKISSRFK
jgi:hypothetical protein